MNHYAEVARELDAALVQNASTARSHLEHFLVADLIDLAGTRDDTRIGRVDTGNVRVDLADVRLDARRDGDSGRIRTPAANVVMSPAASIPWNPATMTMRPSESATRMRSAWISRIDALPCTLSVIRPICPPGKADGLLAELGDSHGQKRHGNHLAGGKQRVHLAGVRAI